MHDPDQSRIHFKSLQRKLDDVVGNTSNFIVHCVEFAYKSKIILGDNAVDALDRILSDLKGSLLNCRHIQQRAEHKIVGCDGQQTNQVTPQILFMGHHLGCDVVASLLCHQSFNDFDLNFPPCYFLDRIAMENAEGGQNMIHDSLREHISKIRDDMKEYPQAKVLAKGRNQSEASFHKVSKGEAALTHRY